MRSITKVFTVAAMVWAGIVIGLMGCDRTLTAPDPISPKANMQITLVDLGVNGALLLQPLQPTGNVSGSSADFPEPRFTLTIFNGISVELRDFRVDYFAEDGVTPLGTRPFAGALHQFIDGGNVPDAGLTTIAPGSAVPPQNPLVPGRVGTAIVQLRIVSNELRSFLAGPNGTFQLFAGQIPPDADDFKGTVIARVSIRGADINGNFVEAVAVLTVNSAVPTGTGSATP